MKKLPDSFFRRKTLAATPELLGKYLVREGGDKIVREKITEVEAYIGPHDLACHASKGRTARTEILYSPAGTIYAYFIYGMYWMLNIVTEETGFPAAILIRGTESFKGPGILTRELGIGGALNGLKLGRASGLWIEEGEPVSKRDILRTPRIGVAYAGKWAAKPYRFVLKN